MDQNQNIIAEITGKGTIKPNPEIKPYHHKLAIAINEIYKQENFSCVEEFCETLGVTPEWISKLWNAEVEPNMKVYTHFVKNWGVNPLFLFHNQPTVFLT